MTTMAVVNGKQGDVIIEIDAGVVGILKFKIGKNKQTRGRNKMQFALTYFLGHSPSLHGTGPIENVLSSLIGRNFLRNWLRQISTHDCDNFKANCLNFLRKYRGTTKTAGSVIFCVCWRENADRQGITAGRVCSLFSAESIIQTCKISFCLQIKVKRFSLVRFLLVERHFLRANTKCTHRHVLIPPARRFFCRYAATAFSTHRREYMQDRRIFARYYTIQGDVMN